MTSLTPASTSRPSASRMRRLHAGAAATVRRARVERRHEPVAYAFSRPALDPGRMRRAPLGEVRMSHACWSNRSSAPSWPDPSRSRRSWSNEFNKPRRSPTRSTVTPWGSEKFGNVERPRLGRVDAGLEGLARHPEVGGARPRHHPRYHHVRRQVRRQAAELSRDDRAAARHHVERPGSDRTDEPMKHN